MYDFASFLGLGGMPGQGNMVVSGDFNTQTKACQDGALQPPCSGVFWFLDELKPGDEIAVEWEEQHFSYIVETLCWIGEEENFVPLTVVTGSPVLTLITAAGDVDLWTADFTHRLVVRASATGTYGLGCPIGSSEAIPRAHYGSSQDEVDGIVVSPLVGGEEAEAIVQSGLGAMCQIDMRNADGTPVFSAPMIPVGGGALVLQWRVWEWLKPGAYDITADCGGEPKTVEVVLGDAPVRRF